ncbi:MAG: ABC transporter substrate-binding protein [Actinomycetota bacterium]|nr:ABC transporter substrate-binding protein [Actinomycetota bacterium]
MAVATTALLTAACTGSDSGGSTDSGDDAAAPTGGSFSTNIVEPSFLAPTANCYDSECSQVLGSLYTGLLRIDPETSEQVLDIAESIESPDGKVWTIKLKDGWTFHNGEPVDAEAYVRAWNYSAYGPNATETGFFFSAVDGYDDLQGEKPKAEELSGLKAVDDLTLEVTLSESFSQWPFLMSYTPAFAPIAKECLDDLKACQETPIGNGPYQMAEPWKHNDSITVERFEDYTGTPGNADQIEFKIYADAATAFRDWQAGNLDIVEPDPSQVPQAEALAGDRILQVDDGSFAYIGFPLFLEEFQDVRIRQALSMAIDRETIIDKLLNGLRTPAQDVVAPFVPGSRDDACGQACTYDPEEAKRLYDEAGGIPGDTINIWWASDGSAGPFLQAIGNGWRTVLGLDYKLEGQPFTPYLATLGEGEFDGPYSLGWLPDYPSPENYLDPVYGEGSANYGQWSGPAAEEFTRLIAEGDSAPTADEGIPSYQAAADVVLEELPVIPLWFGENFRVYSENVDNVGHDPLRQLLVNEVTVN